MGRYYKVVGFKAYDPDAYQAKKFIGRKCEMMSQNSRNEDGSYRGQFGFRDEFKIYAFDGLMLEPWPETPKDEEDIL